MPNLVLALLIDSIGLYIEVRELHIARLLVFRCYSSLLVFSAVNNLPMGYPVLQQPPMSMPGQPHMDTMGSGMPSCHVVNGVPAPSNFHPIRMNSGNE